MDTNQIEDGKYFLQALIRRGKAVLTMMDQKLNGSELPLRQQIDMINSVYGFVETWENALTDINLERQENLIDVSACSAEGIEPKQNMILDVANAFMRKEIEFIPVFKFPFVPLDRYKLGQIGICDVTYVCDTEHEFYMVDQNPDGIKFAEILQTLQNVDAVLEHLPESAAAVFGVRVDGAILRAIRCTQIDQPYLQLLDTGEILTFDDQSMVLFKLPPFYAKLPPFAIKCTLGIVEGDSSSSDYRAYLEANLYRRLAYQILEMNQYSLKVSLNSSQCAEPLLKTTEVEKEPSYKVSLDTLTQDQLDELYEEPLNTTNVMKAVMGYAPRDDQRICPFYDPEIQGCFKGSHCRFEHVAKLSDGWTRDQILDKTQIRPELETPVVGTEMIVIPTSIANVDEFYAHIPRVDLSKALVDLQNKLNDQKYVQDYRMLNHEPHFRELVFAKYPVDNLWYRARVLEFYNVEYVTVFYLDYGNTDVVRMDQLCRWDDQFDYLPFQAIHCRIANIQRLREGHTEAIQQLYNVILDKGVKIRVLDNLSPWEVQVFDDEDNDIGEFLVMTKLAKPREPMIMDKYEGNLLPG